MRYLVALLVLAACGDTQQQEKAAATAETAATAALGKDISIPASDLLIRRESDVLDFVWRAPPELAGAPTLLSMLRAGALSSAEEMQAGAVQDARVRPADAPRAPHFYRETWDVAVDTPVLLNISAEISMYTGGAHPNHGFAVKYWDKKERHEISFSDLFTDWSAAEALLTPAYCTALDAERLSRRGEIAGGMFDDCPPLAEQPVVLAAWPGSGVHGFRVLLGPYVAGPYAEGDYQIELPLTDALRALVKPVYAGMLGAEQ